MSGKKQATILVVDDNEISRLVTTEILLVYGFAVDEAENGEKALSLFKENAYDLVFMDQEMPGMNGVECFERMKAYEKENNLAHTPVALLTANETPTTEILSFRYYLQKPLEHKHIQELMRDICLEIPDDHVSLPSTATDEERDWFQNFKSLSMIDANAALTHSGSLNMLKRLADCFSTDLDSEIADFKEKFEHMDFDGLRIRAHTLKHSTYLIGAPELSARSREAEEFAKTENEEALRSFLPTLFDDFARLRNELFSFEGANKHTPTQGSISDERFKSALRDIKELVLAYDYEDGQLICDMLRDYDLNKEQNICIDQLYEALFKADHEKILQLLPEET
ncbi:MAG: response regulator [Lachnospiraceae bacterium]|nr:response regulator [Lachnospiraceae bacterium]